MIRNFLRTTSTRVSAHEIDMEKGTVKIYSINKGGENCGINFPYSEYETTAIEMGYKSIQECFKELKKRGLLGEEVPHNKQRAEEISAYLQLAKFRNDNGWSLLDIPEKLMKYYKLSQEYADKIVRYITKYNIERHIVKVFSESGDNFTTEINGTPEEIEKYYDHFKCIEFIA